MLRGKASFQAQPEARAKIAKTLRRVRGGEEAWKCGGSRENGPVVWESAGIRFRGYIFCLPALFLKCLISNLDIIQLFKVN